MNIQPINSINHPCYLKKNVGVRNANLLTKQNNAVYYTPSFKGDDGAAIGIISGAALGALTAAIIVASGGLAAPVAAYGLGTVITMGAGAGTHAGGIIGGIIEEKLNKSDKEDEKQD